MHTGKVKTAYIAVSFDGMVSWEARRHAVHIVQQLRVHLQKEGFAVLNFETNGLPFDPYAGGDSIGAFVEMADLVVCLEGSSFSGWGEVARRAVRQHNSVTKRFAYIPALGTFF